MSRSCTICQHLKRAEIDRHLAAGEPVTQLARDHDVAVSSLRRHRVNCLKLATANAIKKDAARGSAAVALLPSRETLSGAYFELRDRIDQIVAQATQQGSLSVAISGLNSIRHTLDSLSRLAGHDDAKGNVAAQTEVAVDVKLIADRLIRQFDQEPETKARIAQVLLAMDVEQQMADAGPDVAIQHPVGPPSTGSLPSTGATPQQPPPSGQALPAAGPPLLPQPTRQQQLVEIEPTAPPNQVGQQQQQQQQPGGALP
jgi:hypothetical protein